MSFMQWESLFKTGQYGRFYVVNSKDAHRLDFRIQLLPKDEKALSNGSGNDCLNKNAVLIFGPKWRHTGNQSGGDCYDLKWFYSGKWIQDFEELAQMFQRKADEQAQRAENVKQEKEKQKKDRIARLLADY